MADKKDNKYRTLTETEKLTMELKQSKVRNTQNEIEKADKDIQNARLNLEIMQMRIIEQRNRISRMEAQHKIVVARKNQAVEDYKQYSEELAKDLGIDPDKQDWAFDPESGEVMAQDRKQDDSSDEREGDDSQN